MCSQKPPQTLRAPRLACAVLYSACMRILASGVQRRIVLADTCHRAHVQGICANRRRYSFKSVGEYICTKRLCM